ncbi:hypothetical protein EG859_15520, partial [Enterococcus faecalis]
MDSAAVAAAAADAELAPLLLEVLRCHVLDATTAARRPVRAALSALGAGGGAGPLSRGRHAALVFKVMWEEAFGVRVGRSRQTFPYMHTYIYFNVHIKISMILYVLYI